MKCAISLAVCAGFLVGCSEQDMLQYQGRPAQTALECEAALEGRRQNTPYTYVDHSNGASVLGASLGKSIVRGMEKSAYRACLGRVANLPGAPVPAAAPVRTGPATVPVYESAGCPPGVRGMYRGTMMCHG